MVIHNLVDGISMIHQWNTVEWVWIQINGNHPILMQTTRLELVCKIIVTWMSNYTNHIYPFLKINERVIIVIQLMTVILCAVEQGIGHMI